MRILYGKIFIALICCGLVSTAQKNEGLQTRIGIIDPDVSNGDSKLVSEVVGYLKSSISDVGGYEIYTQTEMEASFADIQERFPKYCREPRCVSAVGSALQLDRVIYGAVDKGDKTYGVRFTLVDVASKQVIEKVSLEGNTGIPLKDIISVVVSKLHGHVDNNLDTATHLYYGKQVNNMKQLYISAGACVLGGLLWAIINGATVDEGGDVVGDYENFVTGTSGIGTGADLLSLFGRPAALGNSYVAVSDDAYGVFYNPAGLSWSTGREVALCYQPPRYGVLYSIAASYSNKATREIGFGQGFQYTGDSDGLFTEVFFTTAISYKFNDLISFLRPFSIGASVKIMSKRVGNGVSPNSIQGSVAGAGLNLGVQLEVSEKIRGAILFKNAPSVLKWNNSSTGKEYFENEPTELFLGGSFQANYETFLVCEGRIPLYDEQLWKGSCGIERMIFRVMRIRVGIEKTEGFDTPWILNGGFGIKVRMGNKYLGIDGSYQYNTFTPFAHPINTSMVFGF